MKSNPIQLLVRINSRRKIFRGGGGGGEKRKGEEEEKEVTQRTQRSLSQYLP